jgi:hypothetical protein
MPTKRRPLHTTKQGALQMPDDALAATAAMFRVTRFRPSNPARCDGVGDVLGIGRGELVIHESRTGDLSRLPLLSAFLLVGALIASSQSMRRASELVL